jgi:cell division cycle protein 37
MVLDYSKWDALELSDDSDIEVHPNVDKRSFIRAKQNQIHQQRYERRHQIETLKYEHVINEGLLQRIDRLVEALKRHKDDSRQPDELVFQSLIESAGDPADDQPPAPPEGVHSSEKEQPKYSKMIGTLVDQVKKEVDDAKSADRYQAYITGVEGHQKKVRDLQKELKVKLAQLEKEESSKITSDSIHTGFDSSFVSKPKPSEGKAAAAKQPKMENVELLKPDRPTLTKNDTGISSGAEADVEDEEPDDDHIEPSDLGRQFAKIKIGDYKACLQFISEHPEVVAERETDGLLVEAFNSQMAGKETYARQCVHQGLLLQYCRSLGRDGIGIFFKRYGHPVYKAFHLLTTLESPPKAIKPPRFSWTMSTTPTPASKFAPPSSQNRMLTNHPASSRSNFMPSTPAQKSISTSRQKIARILLNRRRVKSLIASHQDCKGRWRARSSMR